MGDIASGTAVRLHRAGFHVVMLEADVPLLIRRTVCFSEAVRLGSATVEDVRGLRAVTADDALKIAESGVVAVLVDPCADTVAALRPDALVDAILAKRNLGTRMDMAPVVVGVGPGFMAGVDCHAAVETKRGHHLGQVLYSGSPMPNTGVPGMVGGYAAERVVRAPADGVFVARCRIGDIVSAGDLLAEVEGVGVESAIDGVVRGMLQDGVAVTKGMKVGDVDPRGDASLCQTVSDKARAVGGAVLEAIMHFHVAWNRAL